MFLSVKVTDQPIPMDRIPIGRLREVPRAKPPGREDIPMIVDTTPKAFPRRPVHPELAAEHDRFQELLPELLKTHRDKWIAMKDGQIVAVGEDEVDVLTQAGEKQPGVLHHARLVTDQPLPIMRSGKFRELPPS